MLTHATQLDTWYAICVVGAFVILESMGHHVIQFIRDSEWIFRLALIVAISEALHQNLQLTALMLTLLLMRSFFLSGATMSRWSEYETLAKNDPRFNPRQSVDIEMADGTLDVAPIRILSPPSARGPLLLFPPTPDQLAEISTNNL